MRILTRVDENKAAIASLKKPRNFGHSTKDWIEKTALVGTYCKKRKGNYNAKD